ncbi:iron ABC transporter ATP-binding protein [methanogenic archaeon mixed culture ISO4-G1]|nr:iron ABC transporter ATP-binding protein [methanogenic archaeon mixed culture ISO4-G1]
MKLKVNDVCFNYGSKDTLKNVTFEACEGKIVGILGQNGCGKTTLLRCIDRMLKPKNGCVIIESPSEDIFDKRTTVDDKENVNINYLSRKELARGVAVVSQSAYVSFPFTAFDAVMMGRYARLSGSLEKDRAAVIDAMKRSGSIEFADRAVNQLSGGELRRVMIARALAQEPNVLLLDEPTLHLDVNHQFDLMNLITELKATTKMTIVIVTHDLMYAARYCDQIILMEKGEIVDAGMTMDVLTKENIRRIFDIDAIVEFDPRVNAPNVVMIGR